MYDIYIIYPSRVFICIIYVYSKLLCGGESVASRIYKYLLQDLRLMDQSLLSAACDSRARGFASCLGSLFFIGLWCSLLTDGDYNSVLPLAGFGFPHVLAQVLL